MIIMSKIGRGSLQKEACVSREFGMRYSIHFKVSSVCFKYGRLIL